MNTLDACSQVLCTPAFCPSALQSRGRLCSDAPRLAAATLRYWMQQSDRAGSAGQSRSSLLRTLSSSTLRRIRACPANSGFCWSARSSPLLRWAVGSALGSSRYSCPVLCMPTREPEDARALSQRQAVFFHLCRSCPLTLRYAWTHWHRRLSRTDAGLIACHARSECRRLHFLEGSSLLDQHG